jgi:hypothetical protein
MKKKTIAALLSALLLITATASAAVQTEKKTADGCQIERPVVSCADQQAADRINADINEALYRFICRNSGTAYARDSKFYYKKMYEDGSSLSLILCEYTYGGGAHGNTQYYGCTYDKATGQRLPLSNFVRIRPEDKADIYSLTVYHLDGSRVSRPWDLRMRMSAELTGNYFLLGGGRIALLFQPYDMACFADGPTYVVLTPEHIRSLNEKNPY